MFGNINASIQNTKYALLSLAEFVEIYALFGRTKQTQNLCVEDQIQFLGLGCGAAQSFLQSLLSSILQIRTEQTKIRIQIRDLHCLLGIVCYSFRDLFLDNL